MKIKTKFGNAKINNCGYYQITSRKEGNNKKLIHRLIFEDAHKCTLLSNAVIHHKDGNKLNNDLFNLELIEFGNHSSLHHKSKVESKKTRTKKSKSISKLKNNTGFYRVSKVKDKCCKQGFIYKYRWWENGKQNKIASVNLLKLKEKVLAHNLPWCKIEEVEV